MQTKSYFIFILAGIIVMAVVLWFFCSGRSAIDHLRERTAPVRTELDNARTAQQREAETIERASEAAGRSTAAVEDSQRTAAKIQRMEQDDIELIRECQSILGTVRERGGKENQN